jgi:glycosyltransferase involved in cell wall biosynthesis
LLYLSGGEGFGLPAWEALCSSLPVIYTNYSAHAEFLSKARAGLPVGGILQPESKSCIWRMIADVPQALETVRYLFADRELGNRLGANGPAFVQQYLPEIQAAKWHQIVQNLTN